MGAGVQVLVSKCPLSFYILLTSKMSRSSICESSAKVTVLARDVRKNNGYLCAYSKVLHGS